MAACSWPADTWLRHMMRNPVRPLDVLYCATHRDAAGEGRRGVVLRATPAAEAEDASAFLLPGELQSAALAVGKLHPGELLCSEFRVQERKHKWRAWDWYVELWPSYTSG